MTGSQGRFLSPQSIYSSKEQKKITKNYPRNYPAKQFGEVFQQVMNFLFFFKKGNKLMTDLNIFFGAAHLYFYFKLIQFNYYCAWLKPF